jgi:methylmalonyl-CoA/ethylmalonyl-CoA epimerase
MEVVPSQKVRVAFFRAGSARIELLEPAEPDSAIAKFLERRGEGLHHLAFTVEDIEARIAELRELGFHMIDDEPREGSNDMRVAFIHPKSTFGVLTELCQPPNG